VAAFYSLGEVKKRLDDVCPASLDLTDVINEVCARAYDIGRFPDAMTEVVVATADKRQDTSGEYDNEWFCYTDADAYDGAIGFQVEGKGYPIKPISSQYGQANMGWNSFVDMGLQADGSAFERRYRMPNGVTSNERVTALLKKKYASIYDDEDNVAVRSMAALKSGILAVNYENENQIQKAQAKWQEFELLLIRDDKQFSGSQSSRIRFTANYNHRPSNFR